MLHDFVGFSSGSRVAREKLTPSQGVEARFNDHVFSAQKMVC